MKRVVVEYGRVAVTEETEVVGKSIVVDGAPLAADKGADEKEECALRLMEVGDDGAYDVVGVAGSNDDLCCGGEGGVVVGVEVADDPLKGLDGRWIGVSRIDPSP